MKGKFYYLLEDNFREYIYDLGIEKDFLEQKIMKVLTSWTTLNLI